jgi:beta-glucanase (GH16 family)
VTAVAVATAGACASYALDGEAATAATPASSAPAAPSAVTASAAKASKWRETFHDEFSGKSVNTRKWLVYNKDQRTAKHAFLSNGHLVLRTAKVDGHWKAAGVCSSRALKQTYGRYVIRARVERGAGTRAVALLWPTGGVWPPEIDFFEIGASDPNRTHAMMTNHYTEHNKMQRSVATGDYTAWHRMAVTWRPGKIVYRRDGKVVAVHRGHSPSHEMWLGLQSGLGSGRTAPSSRTPSKVDFVIDWVRVYRLPGH